MKTFVLILALLTPSPAPAQAETPARRLDPVLVSEYGPKCSRSYDPRTCLRWFGLMNEALDLEAKLNPPPTISYERPTTAEHGQRAGWVRRLSEIPSEMRRLLPRVRGRENRRRLAGLVERLEEEAGSFR